MSAASANSNAIRRPYSARALAGPTIIAVVGVVFVYLAATTGGFLTVSNLQAILGSVSTVGIVAVGMTLIIIGGSLFSLSLAATMAVGSMVFLSLLNLGWPIALLAAVGLGAGFGVLQGGLVALAGANPIMVTVGAAAVIEGVGSHIHNGATVTPPPGTRVPGFLDSLPLGVPVAVFILVAVVILVEWILRRTRFGTQLYVVGDNSSAAKAAGLPVVWVTVVAFTIGTACAALAGVTVGAVTQSASLQLEGTVTFDAFAAVLVGGTSLTGGHGSVLRSACGALVIAAISDLLLLRNYSTEVQLFVKGILVLAAIIIVRLRDSRP